MNLRYWIHPGWFRLIDWWRAERARVAEAEAAWTRMDETEHTYGIEQRGFGFADIRRGLPPGAVIEMTGHQQRNLTSDTIWYYSDRIVVRAEDLARVDVPIGAVTDEIRAGMVLRTRRTGECVLVEAIERNEYDLDGRVVERLRVTRGYGAVPADDRRLTWFELEPVQYVPGIGPVGSIRPTDAL